MAALQAHLERLRVPLPALQRAAVTGVFDAIARTPGLAPAARQDAVSQCLQCGHPAAVEAAVQALSQAETKQLGPPPQDLLLAALAVAPAATAPPLANGLLQLFARQVAADSGPTGAAPASAAVWRAHPLSKALLANPAAAQPLLLGVARLLSKAADSADGASLDRTLAALQPFLSLVLLDPALQLQRPALAPQLHGALARLACCVPSASAQAVLLRLLVSHLPALRLQGADSQAAASAAVGDVMDALESCAEEPDSSIIGALAAGLVCLCHEVAAVQAAALLRQLLAALSHLASYWPGLVAPHGASLALLLVKQQALSSAETQAALALLARLLQHLAEGEPGGSSGSSPQPGQLAPLLLLPLLQHVAFGGSKDVKQWAAHTLGLLRHLGSGGGSSSRSEGLAAFGLHGEAAAAQAAQQLLEHLWQRPLEARHWLASLRSSLARSAAAAGAGTGGGSGRMAREQQQLGSGTLLVLCALLQHPDEAVARAALRAAAAAVEAAPLLGLTLLPLLLHQLQEQVELFLSGKRQRPSHLLLELLRALPAMGRHPATLPFVLRTLQQLLSPDAPEALQAAGLRLMCRLWQASGGRAYPQLRAVVIGFAAPGQQPDLALRVARAECLRDTCLADPDRAVELVGLLQECLSDEAPAVQAIALDCIALLCEADVLEFYATWRVVHRQLPRLPDHPAAAAAWVRLLGSGGLDAAVQPDAAAAIIDALWLAAGHEAAQVRRQAYASLAAFSIETQEEIAALRPLWHFAALLRREQQQRRQAAGLPGPGSSRQRKQLRQAAAECEALSVLPKQLLGGSSASAAELLQRLPEVPVAAVLFFYAPPPPPVNASNAAAAVAARQAAADYLAVFREVLRQPPMAAAAEEDAGAATEALGTWAAFMRRWLAAERAAAKQQEADAQQAATDAALRPLPQLVTAVHTALLGIATGQDQPAAALQRAALAALGSIAEVVRVAMGISAAQQLVKLLQGRLEQQQAAPADVAAAATGLGLSCKALGSGGSGRLHQLLTAQISQAALSSEAAAAAAFCTLLRAVAATGFAASALGSSDVSSSLRLLLSLAAGEGPATDGRLVGAAAAAAGSLLASSLQHGFAPAASEEGADAVLQHLLSVPEAAAKLPHAASAKHGVAAGLAALLSSGTVDPAATPHFKAAVGMLERLALQDADPRTRGACALPLASLCYGVKRSGGLVAARGSSGGGSSSGVSKGLQQLPADGVLRPLLESLLEGRWELPGEDSEGQQEPLTAADAAALLRCAAAAPRLPAMPHGSLGLRLLRSFGSAAGGEEVKQALVALAAAHGIQQQTGLASLVPELLPTRAFLAASGASQLCLLRHLPQVLAALPDAEAARLLLQVAGVVSSPASAAAERHHQRMLLLQLLRSLAALLSADASATGGTTAGSALQGAAAGVLEGLLLQPRLMPTPGPYAQLQAAAAERAASNGSAAVQLASLADLCWAAALHCLQQLPPAQRDTLLQHPVLPPATAALAAAALVAAGVADARTLQHPRNLVLQGGSPAGGRLATGQQDLAALHLGRAVATLAPGVQQQWLLEVLEACKACANPGGAFQLAACIVASSAAAAAAAGEDPQLAAELAVPAGSAVEALPFSLPRLLAAPAWQRNSASVALLLQRLALAVQHLAGCQAPLGGPAPTSPGSVVDGRQVLLARCLLGVREAMPPDSWAMLASLL
ncbi:hypothetical protein ABPG75_004605 [Micractinium tetrahymenae]